MSSRLNNNNSIYNAAACKFAQRCMRCPNSVCQTRINGCKHFARLFSHVLDDSLNAFFFFNCHFRNDRGNIENENIVKALNQFETILLVCMSVIAVVSYHCLFTISSYFGVSGFKIL